MLERGQTIINGRKRRYPVNSKERIHKRSHRRGLGKDDKDAEEKQENDHGGHPPKLRFPKELKYFRNNTGSLPKMFNLLINFAFHGMIVCKAKQLVKLELVAVPMMSG